MSEQERYMHLALEQAELAYGQGEVPVGAVVVCDGVVVGFGYNRRETDKNVLRHAELSAIDMACRTLGGWRLHRCELYVTMEPCLMCAGAILHARIKRVVYGVADEKYGAFGSVTDVNTLGFPNSTEIEGGVLAAQSRELLQRFFGELRQRKKEQRQEACHAQE